MTICLLEPLEIIKAIIIRDNPKNPKAAVIRSVVDGLGGMSAGSESVGLAKLDIRLELISLEENLENLPRHVSDGLRDESQKSGTKAQPENPQNHAASHQPKSLKFHLKTTS